MIAAHVKYGWRVLSQNDDRVYFEWDSGTSA